MNKLDNSKWFESWFDSAFYHLLYNNRDEQEAENFINKLLYHLKLPPFSNILDVGCGKGRHSSQLFKSNHIVHGIDLSKESIDYANENYGQNNLDFSQGDMRDSFGKAKYNCVMNLFTSFGYFQDISENEKVIQNVAQSLQPKGLFVQDFLNADWVRNTLKESETQQRGDITFNITRKIEDGFVKKLIQFESENTSYSFQEEVRLLSVHDFKTMYKNNNLEIIDIFGSYELEDYTVQKSPRLILISQGK